METAQQVSNLSAERTKIIRLMGLPAYGSTKNLRCFSVKSVTYTENIKNIYATAGGYMVSTALLPKRVILHFSLPGSLVQQGF